MTTHTHTRARRRALTALGALGAAAALALTAVPYTQAFEVDTDGWYDTTGGWHGVMRQVASGTAGVVSAAGDGHAAITNAAGTYDHPACRAVCWTGPFSRFGGYADEFGQGYVASIDVYLDPAWEAGTGFDVSVAANGSDNLHQRDFIAHVAKDASTGALLVAASNNTNFGVRQDIDTLANHGVVETAGWYTLRWTFRDAGGYLAVDVELLDAAGTSLFLETRSTTADTIGEGGEVGGNRYMWFTTLSDGIDLHVDNQTLSGVRPTDKQDCKDGGWEQYGYDNQGQCVSDMVSSRA